MTDQPAMFNDRGLFTQHIHGLAIIDPGKLGSLSGPRLDYATSDNDAWFRYSTPGWTPSSGWHSYNLLGDANWVESDRGNSALSLEVRDTLDADLPFFGSAPSGTHNVGKKLVQIACTQGFNGKGDPIGIATGDTPRTWKIIQTGTALKAKTNAYLDTIWLAKLPLQYKSGDRVVEVASGPFANQIKNVSGSPGLAPKQRFRYPARYQQLKVRRMVSKKTVKFPPEPRSLDLPVPNGTPHFFPDLLRRTCASAPGSAIYVNQLENQPWTLFRPDGNLDFNLNHIARFSGTARMIWNIREPPSIR